MWKWESRCGGSASYLFDFPLISLFFFLFFFSFFTSPSLSAFHIPSTSGLCLCAPCSVNSSSWKNGSSVATRAFFSHKGAGREGLACRYEQTVTTDGSGVAAAPPKPRCSLPPGWRPRPINPKPCHLFSTLWIQKGSREGCFTGLFSSRAHLSLDPFLLSVFGGTGGAQRWMS